MLLFSIDTIRIASAVSIPRFFLAKGVLYFYRQPGFLKNTVENCRETGYNTSINELTEDLNMIEITKDTIIGDILDVAPQTAPIFLSIGMHCLGCPSSRGETVEEACMVHGVDCEKLLAIVNEEANK
jgi:hybrid cluster-associated redox disulfide protein